MISTIAAGALWLEASAAAQTLNGDFQFAPSPFSRVRDVLGQAPSSNYLFSSPGNSFVIHPNLELKLPWNAEQHTFLFGPEFHLFLGKRLTINAWALGGVAKRFSLMDPLRQPTDATPPHYGLPSMPINASALNGANGLAMSLGGSIDYRVSDHLTYRIVQPEHLVISVEGSQRSDSRLSTGLRFSFGK